jgi:uncharacterized protein (DUF1499 family)
MHHRTGKCAAPVVGLIAGLFVTAAVSAQSLPDCPKSPNCVSSQASDEARRVAPLRAGNSVAESVRLLTAVLDSLPRVEWTASADNVIQAAFTTRILRFTDDVLFHIDEDGIIQVRSASRVGHSDFGANRDRVEMLREKLAAPGNP